MRPRFAPLVLLVFASACLIPNPHLVEDDGVDGGSSDTVAAEDTEAETEAETETETGTESSSEDSIDETETDADDTETAEPVCGDGSAEGPEQCDDGNRVDGDGCDSDCTFTEILEVDAGGAHTCVLIEGGKVKCWGFNSSGQLGLGHVESLGDDEHPSEVQSLELDGTIESVTGGIAEHTCVLFDDGRVRCWGRNDLGQLGLGHANLIGDDEIPLVDAVLGGPVDEIQVGSFQTCARLGQSVRCWGSGAWGQLGTNGFANVGDDELPSSVPEVEIGGPVKQLALGHDHACALSLIGSVHCWGLGTSGQLGYGNTDVIGDNEHPSVAGAAPIIPLGLDEFAQVSQITAGVAHTCALFETGEVHCWGNNENGQLGRGDSDFLGDDELPSSVPPISLPGDASFITAGGAHTCALLESGDLYCWGAQMFGQLGYGNSETIGDDETPLQAGPVDVGGAIVQTDAGYFHTCALLEGNELRCWGNNNGGQLGYANTGLIGNDEVPADVPPVEVF